MNATAWADGRRVLVIDDDPLWRRLFDSALASEGFAVELASSADEAVEKLRFGTYELMLLDIFMPGMTGIDLLKSSSLRARVSRPRIIAVSGDDTERVQARCVALGVDEFLAKPLSRERLVKAVARVLGSAGNAIRKSEDRVESCRFVTRCPMFPMFRSRAVLRVYQVMYCHRSFERCARYKLASRGTMPEPTLLPDGATLTTREHCEDC